MGLERFNKTVDILVKAYLNDMLKHGYCSACAVGNMVAGSMNLKLKNSYAGNPIWVNENGGYIDPKWGMVFTSVFPGDQYYMPEHYIGRAKDEIDSTGYSVDELRSIELAFELHNRPSIPEDEAMFNGLMAVVDVLADIDGIDLSVAEETKKLFVK